MPDTTAKAFIALYAATVLFFGWIFMGKGAQTDLSGDTQLRKDAGGFGVPGGSPNETSAAIAILRRGDCDSNGPAILQTLNDHIAAQNSPQVELITANAVITEPKP